MTIFYVYNHYVLTEILPCHARKYLKTLLLDSLQSHLPDDSESWAGNEKEATIPCSISH